MGQKVNCPFASLVVSDRLFEYTIVLYIYYILVERASDAMACRHCWRVVSCTIYSDLLSGACERHATAMRLDSDLSLGTVYILCNWKNVI